MKRKELEDILNAHADWLAGKGGKLANLRGAYLSGAYLSGANLSRADLSGANLRYANLSRADLRYANLSRAYLSGADLRDADLRDANLRDADLRGADLSGAYLRYAYLSGADLSGADLSGAYLRYANLSRADLRDANLLCFGNMREIKTLQFENWAIGYTHDTLQIGCQRHSIDKWRKWDTEAGRKWIASMDIAATDLADKYMALVLQIIDASPAVETGHKKETD